MKAYVHVTFALILPLILVYGASEQNLEPDVTIRVLKSLFIIFVPGLVHMLATDTNKVSWLRVIARNIVAVCLTMLATIGLVLLSVKYELEALDSLIGFVYLFGVPMFYLAIDWYYQQRVTE